VQHRSQMVVGRKLAMLARNWNTSQEEDQPISEYSSPTPSIQGRELHSSSNSSFLMS
jgi:hypothetical protein